MNTFNSRLEEVLALAATEPAHRPAFFSQLLEASVLVPGTRADGGDGPLDASTPLDLQHWEKEDGTSVIPFFTSEQALADAVSDAQPYVILPVRTLFALTQGETLFLNPKLPSGKEFTPAEIARLIDEGGSALPAQMIASLTTLFSQTKPVRRAFVALLREQADGPANLLIGIEADSDIATIIHTAGQVATDTLTDDAPIDICQVVEGEGGISHFFSAHITPFYERRWGSFLRDIKVKMV